MMPPDLQEYPLWLAYRDETQAVTPSPALLADMEQRLTWQATSEFGGLTGVQMRLVISGMGKRLPRPQKEPAFQVSYAYQVRGSLVGSWLLLRRRRPRAPGSRRDGAEADDEARVASQGHRHTHLIVQYPGDEQVELKVKITVPGS